MLAAAVALVMHTYHLSQHCTYAAIVCCMITSRCTICTSTVAMRTHVRGSSFITLCCSACLLMRGRPVYDFGHISLGMWGSLLCWGLTAVGLKLIRSTCTYLPSALLIILGQGPLRLSFILCELLPLFATSGNESQATQHVLCSIKHH